MTTTSINLSVNAQKVLSYLQQSNGAWMGKLVEAIYPKPQYTSGNADAQKAYWQWDVNRYGVSRCRPVCGESVHFEATDNFDAKIYAAYKELKDAGLAAERNNGYNEYWIFAKK